MCPGPYNAPCEETQSKGEGVGWERKKMKRKNERKRIFKPPFPRERPGTEPDHGGTDENTQPVSASSPGSLRCVDALYGDLDEQGRDQRVQRSNTPTIGTR